MAKYLEHFIIDLLSDSNKYSINENTRICLCKLLESLGLANITLGFIEKEYKNYNLSELSNIFFYNSIYNLNNGLISIIGVCEENNNFLKSRFIKIKKEYKINHDINCRKKKFYINIQNIKSNNISLYLLKFFINDYLLNPYNYSIKDCTKNELILLINRVDLVSDNNLEVILFNNNSNKGLINILENNEFDNNELNQLFKSIKKYCNHNHHNNHRNYDEYYFKNNNNTVISSRLNHIL